MIKPFAVAKTTKAIRFAYVTAILCLAIVSGAMYSSSVSALELLPDIASVDLPIGDTILDPVVEPITNVTNEILPVDVETTDESLGLTVDPANTPDTPLLQLSAPAPVARIVPTLANAIVPPPPAPSISPLPTPTVTITKTTANIKKNTEKQIPATGQVNEPNEQSSPRSLPLAPFITGVTEFLARIIPDSAKDLIYNLARKDLNMFPYLISAGIFLAMVLVIISIIYTTERYDFFVNGDSRLAQLAQTHDISQIAVTLSAVIGSAAIIACLLAFKAILPS